MLSLRVTSSSLFRSLLSSVPRSDCCLRRGYRKQEPFVPRTMNDLPVPRGSWQRHYDQKQQRYNRYLLGSLGVFGITTYYLVTTDMLIWGVPNLKKMNISSEPIVRKQRTDDALRESSGEFSSSFGDKPTAHEAKPVTVSSDESEVDARVTKTTKTTLENPTKATNSTDVVKQNSGESTTSGEFLNIPAHVPYLLIGGGTASFAAFRAIKGGDAKAKVLVISEEPHYPYMRPPLSKELWFSEDETIRETLKFKQWNGRDRSVFFEPAEFFCKPSELSSRENGGVAVVTSHRVTKLDVEQQIAHLDDGTMISYGKCLVATGGRPRRLETLNGVRDHVTYFRNIDDYRRLENITDHVKSVVVLGGGFLGSELACALAAKANRKRFEVVQTYPEKGNLAKVLPEYLSKWTTNKVADEGVRVVPEVRVTRAAMTADGRVRLTLDNADTLVTDHVVVAVGLEPNTELADSSRLELDPNHGGFRVNAELEARTNLWVAGDAACFYDVQLGRRRVEHHDHAVVSGRLAGENMTGAGKPYTHQSMFWSDLGPEVGFEAIGLVDNVLPTVAVFAQATADDTPKAAVETSGEAVRSEMEQKSVSGVVMKPAPSPQGQGKEDIGKGVVFYTKHDVIVGVVMWNVFNKMHVARQIIKEGRFSEEARGLAKLFGLYDEAK